MKIISASYISDKYTFLILSKSTLEEIIIVKVFCNWISQYLAYRNGILLQHEKYPMLLQAAGSSLQRFNYVTIFVRYL